MKILQLFTCMILGIFLLISVAVGQNNSAFLTGIDSRLRVTDASPINPSANPAAYQLSGSFITVEAWVYATAFPDPQFTNCIVQRPVATQLDPFSVYEMFVWHGSGYPRPAFKISTGAPGSEVAVVAPDTLRLFQWMHLAGTYDGTAVRIYVNGVLRGTVNTTISFGGSALGFYVGRFISNRFHGCIDDVRLWNTARSQTDIQNNKDVPLVGNETGLVGYWRLDAGAAVNGTFATVDQTSNHNDLAVQGAKTSFPAFTHVFPGGGVLTLLQRNIDVGKLDFDVPQSAKIPVSNTGSAPLVVFSDEAKVLAASAIDTVTYGFTIPRDGPFLQNYVLSSNTGFAVGALTGVGLIPHDYYDAGNVQSWLVKDGQIARNPFSGNAGVHFPRNSQLTAVFAAGLMVGAKVSNAVRTAAVGYASEYRPGNVVGGVPANPNNARFHLYKIRRGDNAGNNPDYANWPADLGAPVNRDGTPALLGDETFWSVYNDLDTAAHSLGLGNRFGTLALGAEVRQTVWGFNQGDVLGNTIFIRFNIINRSANTWTDAHFSIWSDIDIGNASDDVVGVDIIRDMGYSFNGDNNDDGQYGTQPPAVGFIMLDGAFQKPIRSFASYTSGGDPILGDPNTAVQLYNYQQGLRRDGSVYLDPTTGVSTPFPFNGDPVAGTGWIDSNPGDRRILLTSGPKTAAPGDTVTITVALTVAQGPDRLSSVALLKNNAEEIRSFYKLVYRSGTTFAATSLKDIPIDQGGKLRIQWTAHPLDISNNQNQVVRYEVYRKVDAPVTSPRLSKKMITSTDVNAAIPIGTWELAGEASATQLPLYSAVIPTLRDSTKSSGMYWSKFFILARTNDPDLFFETPVDSGYSLDNLSPKVPSGVQAKVNNGQIVLSWQPSGDADFQYYAVYRSTTSNFDPKGLSAYAKLTDTLFTDVNVSNGVTYYYRLSAFDFSGNESEYSAQAAANTVGVVTVEPVPREFGLHQNFPNPFNPTTVISYQLPVISHVTLKVYDLLGREVAVLVNEKKDAGRYSVQWDAARLSSGIYFYSLQAGEYRDTKRMLLLK